MAEKGGFPHFMLKEIYEQPRSLRETIAGRVSLDSGEVLLDEANIPEDVLSKIERIHIVACGTSWHAALVGKFLIEDFARIPVEIDYGSEFRYRNPLVNANSLVIAISQSGETADTLAAVREAKAKHARILSICNVVGSMLSRESDGNLYTRSGPEIGVASTKAFTSQLAVLVLIALYLARARKQIPQEQMVPLLVRTGPRAALHRAAAGSDLHLRGNRPEACSAATMPCTWDAAFIIRSHSRAR